MKDAVVDGDIEALTIGGEEAKESRFPDHVSFSFPQLCAARYDPVSQEIVVGWMGRAFLGAGVHPQVTLE